MKKILIYGGIILMLFFLSACNQGNSSITGDTVSIDEIKKPENNLNLNFSAFQEIVYKEIKYDDPEDIVEKLVVKEDEIKYNLSEIKKIMR